jgi:hypothetical protein
MIKIEAIKEQVNKVAATQRAVERAEKALNEKLDAHEKERAALEALVNGSKTQDAGEDVADAADTAQA